MSLLVLIPLFGTYIMRIFRA